MSSGSKKAISKKQQPITKKPIPKAAAPTPGPVDKETPPIPPPVSQEVAMPPLENDPVLPIRARPDLENPPPNGASISGPNVESETEEDDEEEEPEDEDEPEEEEEPKPTLVPKVEEKVPVATTSTETVPPKVVKPEASVETKIKTQKAVPKGKRKKPESVEKNVQPVKKKAKGSAAIHYRGNLNVAILDAKNQKSVLETQAEKKIKLDLVFVASTANVDTSSLLPATDYGFVRTQRGLLAWKYEKLSWVRYVTQTTAEGWEFLVCDDQGSYKQWVFLATADTPLDSPLGLGKSSAHFLVIHPNTNGQKGSKKVASRRWIPVTQTGTHHVFGSAKVSWLGGATGFGEVTRPTSAEERKTEKAWDDIKDILLVSFQENQKKVKPKPEQPIGSGTNRKSSAKAGRAAIRSCRG